MKKNLVLLASLLASTNVLASSDFTDSSDKPGNFVRVRVHPDSLQESLSTGYSQVPSNQVHGLVSSKTGFEENTNSSTHSSSITTQDLSIEELEQKLAAAKEKNRKIAEDNRLAELKKAEETKKAEQAKRIKELLSAMAEEERQYKISAAEAKAKAEAEAEEEAKNVKSPVVENNEKSEAKTTSLTPASESDSTWHAISSRDSNGKELEGMDRVMKNVNNETRKAFKKLFG